MAKQRDPYDHPDPRRRKLRDGEGYRKSDGRYTYRYTKYKHTTTIYAKTLDELRNKEQELERKRLEGLRTNKKTLNAIFDEYIELASLKHTTKMTYMYNYDKYVRDEKEGIGAYNVDELTADSIYTFYRKLLHTAKDRDKTKNLTIATIGIIDTILHPLFQKAIRMRLIASNPADGVLKDIKKRGYKRNKRYALSVQEQAQFLDFVKNSKTYQKWYPLLAIGFLEGLRIGELLGLTWKDVNFKNNTLNINHQLVYSQEKPTDQDNLRIGSPTSSDTNCRFYINTPKTDSGIRTIHLFKEAKEILEELYKNRPKQTPTLTGEDGKEYTDFIFLNRLNNLHRATVVNRAIKRMAEECNKEEDKKAKEENREPNHVREFTCHVMRHTAATRLFEAGADIVFMKNFLGHANIQVTIDVYTDLMPQKAKSISEELEEKYSLSKLN